MNEIKKKALIYIRVSSERQKNEGHGLEAQEHRCREYAGAKGYEVEKVFSDSASGGGDFMNRPGMVEMLEHIDHKAYNEYIAIFDDLKRFARDTEFHLKLRTALKARNVTPECLNFNFDDTPEGRYVETIIAATSELERHQNRRQVLQKMRVRLEKGYWPFFPPPGYKSIKDPLHGKLLTIEEPDASIIKEAFEGYASDRFNNQSDVQHFLQNKGFIGKGKSKVHLEKVKRLLTRVIYAGYIEYPEWEVPRRQGHHQPIINLETFEKVKQKLNNNQKVHSRADFSLDFSLRGFVLCSKCVQPMTAAWATGKSGAKFPYYRCKTKMCIERNKSIKKNILDESFNNLLKGIAPRIEVLNYTEALLQANWDKRILDLQKHLKNKQKVIDDIKVEIDVLIDRIKKTRIESMVEIYEQQISELKNKQLVLEENLKNLPLHKLDFKHYIKIVFAYLENPYFVWLNGDIYEKRLVLKLVFSDKLIFDRELGFETPNLSLPLKVFQYNELSNPKLVEMAGIEPACKRGSYMDLQRIVHLCRRSEFKRSG